MIKVVDESGFVAFEFDSREEFESAFPEGVNEPGWRVERVRPEWIKCELPNTDALGLFRSLEEMRAMLAQHGSPKAVFDADANLWRVPAFAESREKFTAWKLEDTKRWGAE